MKINDTVQKLLCNTTNILLKSNTINKYNFTPTINTILSTRKTTAKQLNQLSNFYKQNELDRHSLLSYYQLATLFPVDIEFKPTTDMQIQGYLMYLSAIHFKPMEFELNYGRINDLRTWHQVYIYSLVYKKDLTISKQHVEKDGFVHRKSFLERNIDYYLKQLEIPVKSQFKCKKTMYTFDYYVPLLDKAVEIQGPSHYVQIDDLLVPNMKTRLKLTIVKQFYRLEFEKKIMGKRKTADKLIVENPVPTDTQQIAKITTIRGNQLFDCILPDTSALLVQLPQQFINKVFVKLNGFVIIELNSNGKIDGDIVHVLFKDDLKNLKKLRVFPKEFLEEETVVDDDLFVNNNRIVDSDDEEY
ncbi:hypothetical protein HDV01_006196 [Terramyces sp. JEL0728]|nr:hypothetical protein HDV01_006196 [Terramyces sp. JEL0728]